MVALMCLLCDSAVGWQWVPFCNEIQSLWYLQHLPGQDLQKPDLTVWTIDLQRFLHTQVLLWFCEGIFHHLWEEVIWGRKRSDPHLVCQLFALSQVSIVFINVTYSSGVLIYSTSWQEGQENFWVISKEKWSMAPIPSWKETIQWKTCWKGWSPVKHADKEKCGIWLKCDNEQKYYPEINLSGWSH